MFEFSIWAAFGVAALGLGLAFYVGYLQGKASAEKTTYGALNELITSWNKFLKMMPQDKGPRLDRKG